MKKCIIFLFFIGLVSIADHSVAKTLVSTDFNAKKFAGIDVYKSSGGGYCNGGDCNYASSPNHSGSGYSMHGDHTDAYNFLWRIGDNLMAYVNSGIYIRYYVYFPTTYELPGECGGGYNNHKVFKMGGPKGNVEIHWNNLTDPYNSLKYQYTDESGKTGPLAYGSFSNKARKGQWNKIEIYIRIPSTGSRNSSMHVQVNDSDVWNLTNLSFNKNAYEFIQSPSVRSPSGSCLPKAGRGDWFADDLTIVYGEGDLTNKEPSEPNGEVVNEEYVPSSNASVPSDNSTPAIPTGLHIQSN